MSKLISNIQNYPFSKGSIALSNKLLLEDDLTLKSNTLHEDFKDIFEISRDILFYKSSSPGSDTWNDLLNKDLVFQLSRFVTIPVDELNKFFTDLPIINHFTDNVVISPAEYQTLAYQRFQILQYLFWLYKSIGESLSGEIQEQVVSIIKNGPAGRLFIQYQTLMDECLVNPPVLIEESNKLEVPGFNEIIFLPLQQSLTDSLKAYYNPANEPGYQVLMNYNNAEDKLKAANEYLLSLFRSIMQIQSSFNAWADNKLKEITSSAGSHQPHISLLIAFVKLKQLFDTQYNRLIHKNTNFVFSEILQLQKQSVLPDIAYINIELAKNVNEFFIPKDSLFKAGKNSLNKPVFYKSIKDIVLNSAKIYSIKSSVRVKIDNQLSTISGAQDAPNPEWQVNDAWLPFNDLSESFTGLALECRMLEHVKKKDTEIAFIFEFGNNVPLFTEREDKFTVSLLHEDGGETTLKIDTVNIGATVLTLNAKIEKDLKQAAQPGVNVRVRVMSPPVSAAANNDFVLFYRFLLKEHLSRISVKLYNQVFTPTLVRSSAGNVDGETTFPAFGTRSLIGSSFRIEHPFIQFSIGTDITINWTEKLESSFKVTINGTERTVPVGSDASSTISNVFRDNQTYLRLRLSDALTSTFQSKIQATDQPDQTITTTLPKVLMVKSIELNADPEEIIYIKNNPGQPWIVETNFRNKYFIRSLHVPYINKKIQKGLLHVRHRKLNEVDTVPYYNHRTIHLYPFGEKKINTNTSLTLLPDYTILGFNDYDADLCIGLTSIKPGQSISLLFEIAEETAEQSQLEAVISWHFVSNEEIIEIDSSKIIDSTNNFLQSGLIQLSLPDVATKDDLLLYGNQTYWLIARCNKNYEVVANIKSIKTNGVAVQRVLDDINQETKRSVAAGTIENIFPKSASIKTVAQNTPTQNGREMESDEHYFWRSSQRLRHKNRAINQWDFEQLVLEQFSNVYRVKCLNHAYYKESNATITAKPGNVVVSLIPFYIINTINTNFQPAIPMSKLLAIKSHLQHKTSAFLKIQVFNPFWDEISISLDAMANEDVFDRAFFSDQLNTDIKKFLCPWAFDTSSAPAFAEKIYVSTLVDYIDELPYVHHILELRIFKNTIEVIDEINATSEIHFLTSAPDHTIRLLEYAD